MMLSAALQLAFFGMLRVSEYTAQSSTSWDVERTLVCFYKGDNSESTHVYV